MIPPIPAVHFALAVIFLAGLPEFGSAQFSSISTYGGEGDENGRHLVSDQNGGFFVAGTHDAPFSPINDPLPVFGEEDFFLGKVDGQGNWQWAKSGGSFLDDEIRALRLMPDGGVVMAGTFWLEFTYGDLSLKTSENIKGIFIVRLDSEGKWQWGKVINGADLKEVNDVKIASGGEIFLTGHFSEALQFGTLRLEAVGKNDAFLLKLTPGGELLDWQQLGFRGTTRGQCIALHPDGGYYWGGVYDDTLQVASTELYANTFDRDIFLIRYDKQGDPVWVRRAGGVFEEELAELATDTAGNLFATGYLIGVMNLSETISIQSRNGNPDIFLFKYEESGDVQWARAIGGDLIDQPSSLCLLGRQLIIGGTYYEQIAWDDFFPPVTGGINGFVAGFDQANGLGKWVASVSTESIAFVEALNLDDQDRVFVLGSFRDTAHFGSVTVNTSGNYDFFLATIAPVVTPATEPERPSSIRVYPNPVRDLLYLDGLNGRPASIRFYDSNGRLVKRLFVEEALAEISVNGLIPGQYWLVVRQENVTDRFPIIIIPD